MTSSSPSTEEKIYWIWKASLDFDNSKKHDFAGCTKPLKKFTSSIMEASCLRSKKIALVIQTCEDPSPGKLVVVSKNTYLAPISYFEYKHPEQKKKCVFFNFIQLNHPHMLITWVLNLDYSEQYEKFFECFEIL